MWTAGKIPSKTQKTPTKPPSNQSDYLKLHASIKKLLEF